jgi:asparagine synthase (glutamine-hydrolysing)
LSLIALGEWAVSIELTVVAEGPDAAFIFPDSAPGKHPLIGYHEYAGCRAALVGRLYYRADRLQELENRVPADRLQSCTASDVALALALYREDGWEALARLEGDFALIVWDGHDKRLLAMRDPLGGFPLFWSEDHAGRGFIISTSLSRLRQHRSTAALNLDYVADYFMLPGWAMPEPEDGRCVWRDVQRVLAGTLIIKTLPDGAVQQHRYWSWPDRIVDPCTSQLEQLAGRYCDLLCQAVAERVRGRTAAHLSGGMDSTAVCLLAAKQVQEGKADGPILGLSLVYDRLSTLAREKAYLDLIDQRDGLRSLRLLADDLLDFDCFADAPVHDEPCPWLWRTTMEQALIRQAQQEGIATILTGVGADEIVDQMPYHLSAMLRRGAWWSAWKEASRWGRADNCSFWRYLYPFGIAHVLPAWMRVGIGASLRGGFASWETLTEWTIAPWVNRAFAKDHRMHRVGVQNVHRIYHRYRDVGMSQSIYNLLTHVSDYSRWHLAAPHGILLAHPFLDPRLICFGLGMLTRYQPDPNHRKAILAESMRDVLPEAIRTRQSKGAFNEVYARGLARNLPALQQLVREAPIDDLGILDKNVLLTCLNKAALGAGQGLMGSIRLNVTLTFLEWLTLQDKPLS